MGETYKDVSEHAFRVDFVCDGCGEKKPRRIVGRPGHEELDQVLLDLEEWERVERRLGNGLTRWLLTCSPACKDKIEKEE